MTRMIVVPTTLIASAEGRYADTSAANRGIALATRWCDGGIADDVPLVGRNICWEDDDTSETMLRNDHKSGTGLEHDDSESIRSSHPRCPGDGRPACAVSLRYDIAFDADLDPGQLGIGGFFTWGGGGSAAACQPQDFIARWRTL